MKRILIWGLKDPVGGVEKIVKSYTDRFPVGEVVCDYVIFGDGFSLESEIAKRGGEVYYLPNRVKHPIAYRSRLKQIFIEKNYDAVWLNVSGLTNIDALKYGKKYHVPLRIVHSHAAGFTWTGRLMKYLVPLFHYKNQLAVDRYATNYWACSEPAGRFMYPKRVWDKILCINNAVDTEQFCPNAEERHRARHDLGVENNFVVCHAGRMSREKNQLFLLEIFNNLLAVRGDAKLLFIGDGELHEQIMEKAKELGITEHIIFTGFIEDLAPYYRASDVFCLPSLNEGLGLVVIEAQACGVPCVVSYGVPKAADITGCVKYLGLDQSVEEWSAALMDAATEKIENPAAAIKTAGYDINHEAKKLYRFFKEGSFNG